MDWGGQLHSWLHYFCFSGAPSSFPLDFWNTMVVKAKIPKVHQMLCVSLCCLSFIACDLNPMKLWWSKRFRKKPALAINSSWVGGRDQKDIGASVPVSFSHMGFLAKRGDEIFRSLFSRRLTGNSKTRAKMDRWKLLHLPLWKWVHRTVTNQITFCYKHTVCWWALWGLLLKHIRKFLQKKTFAIMCLLTFARAIGWALPAALCVCVCVCAFPYVYVVPTFCLISLLFQEAYGGQPIMYYVNNPHHHHQ